MRKYFQAPWRAQDIIIVILMTTGLLIAGIFAGEYLGMEKLLEANEYKRMIMPGLFLLQTLILLLPLLIYTAIKYGNKKKYFGFKKIGFWKNVWTAVWAYFVYIILSIIIITSVLVFGWKIPGYQVPEPILPMFGADLPSLIIAGIILVIIAPIVEEIFFRGFLLRSLCNTTGLWIGSIMTAVFFAVPHWQFESIIPIFILALILNFIVIKKKSIWPAISFHILNNAIAFGIEILILKDIIELDSLI